MFIKKHRYFKIWARVFFYNRIIYVVTYRNFFDRQRTQMVRQFAIIPNTASGTRIPVAMAMSDSSKKILLLKNNSIKQTIQKFVLDRVRQTKWVFWLKLQEMSQKCFRLENVCWSSCDQNWSPQGRFWLRGHILMSLASKLKFLASKSTDPRKCSVPVWRTAFFFWLVEKENNQTKNNLKF